MLVEGALIDAEGVRRGYAIVRSNRVVETGQLGTASSRGSERRVRGIVVPAPVDGHAHFGDAASGREPPHLPVNEIVAPPSGLKFRILAETPPATKVEAMREALRRLEREGTAAVIDFREEGVEGVRLLRRGAARLRIRAVVLGRPLARPLDRKELGRLLRVADGVGLSAAADVPVDVRRDIAHQCRASGKYYALHASEVVRESVDDYLDPRPDLLVHLLQATSDDLEQVVREHVTVAVCPRSNALFHQRPPLDRLERLGAPTLLGTDNAMFQSPSMLRELEFAYLSARQANAPVTPGFLVRCAFLEPWRFLREPTRALLGPAGTAAPLVFRLPPEDPEYQLVTRATEHLIVRAERSTPTPE